ncbi:MAG: serine/threonine protein kinase [Candidatus Schekmanbacteria bacterium]|nr:serine/threonine protein kinase [Candidatus Schekmanbacteria bacterium]
MTNSWTCPGCGAKQQTAGLACTQCGTADPSSEIPVISTAGRQGPTATATAPDSALGSLLGVSVLTPGQTLLSKYKIRRILGQGGMGTVYEAMDTFIGRRVAIKTIKLGGDQEETEGRAERLAREARAAGQLMHPNIVVIHDAGQAEGMTYIIMEFVDGLTLGALRRREGPLPRRRAIGLVAQVARALECAHEQQIIHRDIKPPNIMVCKRDHVKVADFGIAKVLSETTQLTAEGGIVGTPQYLSPEQVAATAIDGRSDLFSLAGVFHELLTGQPPFGRENVHTLIFKIMSGKREPFSLRGADVTPRLQRAYAAFFDRALATKPADRFPDAAAFEEALAELDRLDGAEGARAAEVAVGSAAESPAPAAAPAAAGPDPESQVTASLTGPPAMEETRRLGARSVPPGTPPLPQDPARASEGADGQARTAGLRRDVHEQETETEAPAGAEATNRLERPSPTPASEPSPSPSPSPIAEATPGEAQERRDAGAVTLLVADARAAAPRSAPHLDPDLDTARRGRPGSRLAIRLLLAALLAVVGSGLAALRLGGGASEPVPLALPALSDPTAAPARVSVAAAVAPEEERVVSFLTPTLAAMPASPPPSFATTVPTPTEAMTEAPTPPARQAAGVAVALDQNRVSTPTAAPPAATAAARTAPAVASAAPAALPGKLLIEADAWFDLTIDGEKRGRFTYPRSIEIPAGRHRLQAVNPELAEISEWIDVPAGEEVKKVYRFKIGWLTVRTTPPATAVLGGEDLGQTPITRLEKPSGVYVLTLSAPGHKTKELKVFVRPRKETPVEPVLEPLEDGVSTERRAPKDEEEEDR